MKRQISVLDQSTIDKIAAGEVVERPSSVVKELVENAIDAGASAITVEIKEGGTTFIRITDNGTGIEKEQVPLAFLRHATSKIRKVEDLSLISSLGFRGEALSSIAAVSRVELITKPHEQLIGVRYQIEGGMEKGMEEIGAPDGTTFLIRDLFYNTPARAKFLKTPTTEAGYISSFIEQLALSHPHISFKYMQNGQTKLHTSGNNNLKEAIYQIYGRDITRELIEIHTKDRDETIRIDGFIGKPVISRGNRNFENYYVNGRYVKSKIVTKAVEDAFRYGKLVLATITYNGDIFPFMRTYIENLTERSYQNRTIGLIENGSWAPAAARIMQGMFEKSKNITWLENNVKITSSLSEANEAEIEAMAEELCK